MVIEVLLERLPRHRVAINQPRTTHQLATSLALSEVNPTALGGRASSDLPRFPPSQNQVEPFFFHDESCLRRAPDATTLTRPFLAFAFLYIACVPKTETKDPFLQFEDRALFLKHSAQNFARGDVA